MENSKRFWYALSLLVLLILTICILKVSECSRRNIERKLLAERQLALRALKKDFSFDILIFTQHWPYTVCSEWMEEHKGNECVLPKIPNSWAIHGVWPTKYHEIGPLYCNDTWTFDMKEISDIEDEMKEKWINIEKGTPLDGLWKHEWEKHGTCAAQKIEKMNTEKKYFSEGLEMFDNYSITKLLQETYIKPSIDETYKLDEIHTAINRSLGNNFAIICEKDRQTKQQMLFEIRICFDKELKLHSCDGIVVKDDVLLASSKDEIITNCKRDIDIVYPSKSWVDSKRWMMKVNENMPQEKSWMFQVENIYKLVKLLQWATL